MVAVEGVHPVLDQEEERPAHQEEAFQAPLEAQWGHPEVEVRARTCIR